MYQQIRQSMPVIGVDGQAIGSVRGVDGDQLLLEGEHDARLPLALVEQVLQDVRLRLPAREVIDKFLDKESDAIAAPTTS